ncbi:DNA annealing helicase and endonuclease ZRANB3 isoform X2 [Oryza brachyantha]|uniref:DNA annealing helicase and endonuclease ZRANB3 isoform X2 n=1 Tax=Oryza brachyantha TaxID=4533 RepID=UPI001ADCFFB9|nr:DNA annealing helicase and endonuclease ZRANB3 isoform X2 [Oryza brachyantha]
MGITEEQRLRIEANRLAALERRKRYAEAAAAAADADASAVWRLAKCPRFAPPQPPPPPQPPVGFKVVLEVCSPEDFSVAVGPADGVAYPGEAECLRAVQDCVASAVPFSTTQSQSGHLFSVFKLMDHELVLKCLKKLPGVAVQDIPYKTRNVIKNLPKFFAESCASDKEVDELLTKLPQHLRDALLPFQLEGVRFGLQRNGRCLIADEMGLGKTLQAIAIACCYKDEGPVLIVCPAVLRYTWAEELERWDPSFLPKDIHLVFGHQGSLERLGACPRAVVISYQMLSRLRTSMMNRRWALMIVDESHNIRCTQKKHEKNETQAVLELAPNISRIVLLSGTPSLSRPFDIYHQINILWPHLLGSDKFDFANKYCLPHTVRGFKGRTYRDFSKGVRLTELNVLLSQTLMIRRLKEHLLNELPPKRRQIIRLKLDASDIKTATSSCIKGVNTSNEIPTIVSPDNSNDCEEVNLEEADCCKKSPRDLSAQEIGIAKIPGFSEWFLNHFIMKEPADNDSLNSQSCQKTIIFAHHLKVLDGVQVFVTEQGIKFVRIDGSTFPRERKDAVDSFRLNPEVKVAIIGITAGGVGLDFSSAQNVVFVELPKSASELLQAEDRAHRRGQTNAVNIYIFCAKSLFRVSSLMNGKKDAIREIEVDQVYHLEESSKAEGKTQHLCLPLENHNADCGNGPEQNLESDDMSIENLPGLNEIDFESDFFSIRTIPLHFEDESLHTVMQSNPSPTAREEIACNSSISQASVVCPSISSAKSVKARRRLSEIFQTLGLPATTDCHIQVKFLRFEVSQHTGRIHVYICVPGHDSRPRPLFENFLPEEVDSPLCSDNAKKARNLLLKRDPAFCNTFKAFVKEWLALRPIEQKRLLGKPLQLPLSLELCYQNDNINHSTKGLLKGGSKRRVTPLCDVSNPLPENAEWRNVVLHNGTTKERVYTQAWTVHDEPLCKLCQEPCNGEIAKSPEYFEDLFCGLSCFEVYRSRTSNRFLRKELFEVEHGICSKCNLDCQKLVKHIKPLCKEKRAEYIRNVAPNIAGRSKLLDKLVREPSEGNAWHADHIVPVYRGGGECTLENLRTLCVACHYEVTRAQQKERKELTKRAKELLKNTVNNQQKDEASEAAEELDDKYLLVAVPGSAYS